MQVVILLDTLNAGSYLSTATTTRIKQNVTDALFTARVFLPGLFEKNVFLILNIFLPLVDFLTDAINAGNGLHTKYIRQLTLKKWENNLYSP
mgnify:CR=1 FL=1